MVDKFLCVIKAPTFLIIDRKNGEESEQKFCRIWKKDYQNTSEFKDVYRPYFKKYFKDYTIVILQEKKSIELLINLLGWDTAYKAVVIIRNKKLYIRIANELVEDSIVLKKDIAVVYNLCTYLNGFLNAMMNDMNHIKPIE